METTTVISLGGSLVAPDKVDVAFLKGFYSLLKLLLEQNPKQRFIIITGGGALARDYQRGYVFVRENEEPMTDSQDWIGIAATRNNAEIVRRIFEKYCLQDVVTDPEANFNFSGQVLVASGWKPGRSTDYVAVALAERFGADTVINLTNIARVHADDPRKNPDARPLDDVTWKDYRAIIGGDWTPGRNAPFDPIASERAERAGLKVIIALGNDLENLKKVLDGGRFFGTTIHP